MKRKEKQIYVRIEASLEEIRDQKNAAFLSALLPQTDPARVLGIKSPVLRKFAGMLKKEGNDRLFLSVLPHRYLEEDLIHAFLISGMKDYPSCMEELERFLPFADNWVITDAIRPAVIKKHREETEAILYRWLERDHPFTVRTAVGLFMAYYLEEGFRAEQMEKIASLDTSSYYVHMAVAWYMATALAKQKEAALAILRRNLMDQKTHNKTIQKACESYRISDDLKRELRMMKRR